MKNRFTAKSNDLLLRCLSGQRRNAQWCLFPGLGLWFGGGCLRRAGGGGFLCGGAIARLC